MRKYVVLWNEAPSSPPIPGPRVSLLRQLRNEKGTEAFVDTLEAAFDRYPAAAEDRGAWERSLAAAGRRYLFDRLAFDRAFEPVLFSDAYANATHEFLRRAREFDPDLASEDLFQATRNVWIMNCVQLLLDLPVETTPSVFAYSLLYPYTDNYLDHPGITARAKAALVERLGRRLRGADLDPATLEEDRIFRLVAMIENQFPRGDHGPVWDSVLAIHRAQVESLRLHRPCLAGDAEILGISVEKGGSSVLADGFLVAGRLTPDEADFLFGYGVFLQLLDDLQDVSVDGAAGHQTMFSSATRGKTLDPRASRLWHFTAEVLDSDRRFREPNHRVLKDLIRTSCAQLFLQAIGANPGYYGRRFRRRMNRRSPVRFSWLRKRAGALRSRFDRVGRSLERRLEGAAYPSDPGNFADSKNLQIPLGKTALNSHI